MTLDWSVVWEHRWALAAGAAMTIQLTVLTMLLAVPGGILLAAMRLSRRVAAAKPLSDFIAEELKPGPASQSDEEMFVRGCDDLQTVYHPSSTCRMGSDARSVVDPELRVRGVQGLWVADASVMPRLVSGNTNAPSIMIGERCADFVKADLG